MEMTSINDIVEFTAEFKLIQQGTYERCKTIVAKLEAGTPLDVAEYQHLKAIAREQVRKWEDKFKADAALTETKTPTAEGDE